MESFRPSPIPKLDAPELERAIEKHLDDLPGPLRKTWQDKYEQATETELPALEKSLRTLMRERERVLFHAAPRMSEFAHSEADTEKIYATLARIGEASENPTLFAGRGKTGEVYRDTKDERLCYKTIINFASYESWNSVEKEAHFLEELENFSVEGVRTPRVYSVIDLPEVKAIVMEFLPAKNIDIIEEKKLPLPEGFDVRDFFRRIRAYIQALHERNIYHRDLHGGNILIGDDGTPYIIDFGQSAHAFTSEHAYDIHDRSGNKLAVSTSDEDWLNAVEAKLTAYARSRQIA